jgi:hypothetical protein
LDALLGLLALLLHWRAVVVFAVALLLGLLLAMTVPTLGGEIVLTASLVGAALGIALESRHIAKNLPPTEQVTETTSSRVVAMIGFAAIGAVPGWLITTTLVPVAISLLALAGIPLLAVMLVSASQGPRPTLGITIAATASSWAGFLLALWLKFTLLGPNAA